MTRRTMRRGALLSALCLVLAICCIVPSIRGWLTQIAQQITGREIVYFNNLVNQDNDDTNNYNFGYDRKVAADAAVKAGKVGSVVDWVAKKDGTGDFFYSISVDPALCAAVALHMDETLALPEKILIDEQNELIGQRADKAHLHFLRESMYWDRAVSLITQYLTSGSIEIQYVKKTPKSMMYMKYNGLEGNKPSVIVRDTNSSKGYVVVFDLGKPGSVRFRLNCGYQPIDVGYWPTPTPVPPGPEPEPEPEPSPTPTLEPKKPDAGPQGQVPDNPDYGGGPNHDNDTTYSDQEPEPPQEYHPPAPPTNPPATPTPKPATTKPPVEGSELVVGDGQQHEDLATVQEEQHSEETVEESVHDDGVNEGDLDESAVE